MHCGVAELLSDWQQLDCDIQKLLLQHTRNSVTFNATDELKADLLQSSFNLTPTNWVTGSRDSCHVQLTHDDSGFTEQTPNSRQVNWVIAPVTQIKNHAHTLSCPVTFET